MNENDRPDVLKGVGHRDEHGNRAEGLDAHRLGGLIERAIRDSKRQSGGLLPDGWTLVEMALAYPPETPTEPSQSQRIPARPSDLSASPKARNHDDR